MVICYPEISLNQISFILGVYHMHFNIEVILNDIFLGYFNIIKLWIKGKDRSPNKHELS